MRKNLIYIFIVMGVTFVSLPSCNGIFENIYDLPVKEDMTKDFGFIKIDEATKSGTVYVNTSAYNQWVYLDFQNKEARTIDIDSDTEEPEHWDIAIHRYDTKTNGGKVIDSGFTGFDILKLSGKLPEGKYVEDIWTKDRIAVDMSGMMEGNIKYIDSYYNPELSKWLNVDTSTMPPIYKMSHKVYVVKLKDNKNIALKLTNYMNASGIKGYMTIDYIYPLEF